MSFDEKIKKKITEVGIDLDKVRDSGFYVQLDNKIVKTVLVSKLRKLGVIVENLEVAVEKYPWARDYLWKAVNVEKKESGKIFKGYFIYIPPNKNINIPIEACFLVTKPGLIQEVHNVVVVDENSSLEMVTGCTAATNEGLHMGISEFYIGKNAKLTFTMLHNWTPGFKVRPITGVIVDDHGKYIENYINVAPGAWMKAAPHIRLGTGSKAVSQSLIVGRGDAKIDYGTVIELNGEGSVGEIISRVVTLEKSEITSRGRIVANAKNTRGHIECKGLMISEESRIKTIPELENNVVESELTHEAAIGKISKEQIDYLMARGFTEEEATNLILQDFMKLELKGVNEGVKKVIESTLRKISSFKAM